MTKEPTPECLKLAGYEPPPLSKTEFESFVGSISDKTWRSIEESYVVFGWRQQKLQASSDTEVWSTKRKAVEMALERAMKAINKARQHDEFLLDASESYSIQNFNMSFTSETDAHQMVTEAYGKLSVASNIVRQAQKTSLDFSTEANARACLVRDIWNALNVEGTMSVTDGWKILTGAKITDMKPFEQLIFALNLYTPKDREIPISLENFTSWCRDIVRDQK